MPKTITLYKSALCPRCHMAAKYLHQLAEDDRSLQVIEVDVFLHPVDFLSQGIRLIPAIKTDDRWLHGVYLTRQKIEAFLYAQQENT